MTISQTLTMLLAGAVLGTVFVLMALALRRYTRQILFAVLVVAAVVYAGFALYHGAGVPWLLVELVGVAVYGSVGYRGLRGSMLWLAAGWTLHPLWDVLLHLFGPGASFAPASYAVVCVSFDLVVAGVVAYVARRSRLIAGEPSGARVLR